MSSVGAEYFGSTGLGIHMPLPATEMSRLAALSGFDDAEE
jgi:hypothetical protein